MKEATRGKLLRAERITAEANQAMVSKSLGEAMHWLNVAIREQNIAMAAVAEELAELQAKLEPEPPPADADSAVTEPPIADRDPGELVME